MNHRLWCKKAPGYNMKYWNKISYLILSRYDINTHQNAQIIFWIESAQNIEYSMVGRFRILEFLLYFWRKMYRCTFLVIWHRPEEPIFDSVCQAAWKYLVLIRDNVPNFGSILINLIFSNMFLAIFAFYKRKLS